MFPVALPLESSRMDDNDRGTHTYRQTGCRRRKGKDVCTCVRVWMVLKRSIVRVFLRSVHDIYAFILVNTGVVSSCMTRDRDSARCMRARTYVRMNTFVRMCLCFCMGVDGENAGRWKKDNCVGGLGGEHMWRRDRGTREICSVLLVRTRVRASFPFC